MSKKESSEITFIEQTLIWMASRYAMSRSSIASATLPKDIISKYGERLNVDQKKLMLRDILEAVTDRVRFSKIELQDGYRMLENIELLTPEWMKFASWLDDTNEYIVTARYTEDGSSWITSEQICFRHDSKYYIKNNIDWRVADECIMEIHPTYPNATRWVNELQFPASDHVTIIKVLFPHLFEHYGI
jgi:hypothetical protein